MANRCSSSMWQKVRLGEIAAVSSGGTPSRSVPEYWNGNVPWISTSEIDFNVITSAHEHITDSGLKNSSARVFPKGTLVMAMFGHGVTRGKVAILGIDAAFNQACAAIIPKNGYSPKFLFHYLSYLYLSIRYLGHGSNQPNLNAALIKGIELFQIPLLEQKAIADLLDCWDHAADQIKSLIAGYQRLRLGLMQQLLTGKRRFSNFEIGSWHSCCLRDILKEISRPVVWNDDQTYRLVSVRRWSGGIYLREELRGREIKVKKLATLRPGDMLISHIQSAYGAMALVSPEFDGYQVSELYSVLVPLDPDKLDIRYFAYLTQQREMWHKAYLASNGFFAERLRLNFDPSEFLKQQVLVPDSIDEQRKIVLVFENLDRQINFLSRKLEQVKQQKNGLMQKLLTREIRVKAPTVAIEATS